MLPTAVNEQILRKPLFIQMLQLLALGDKPLQTKMRHPSLTSDV